MKVKNIYSVKILLFILFIFGFSSVRSQLISENLSSLQQEYPGETLYLQTDRSGYSSGEIIWFKAYVLHVIGTTQNQLSQNLFIAIVDRDSLEIIRKVFTIENNQVSGNIEIPTKVTSGNYILVAFTSSMKDYPLEMYFSKEIYIEREDDQTLFIDIQLKDTISHPDSQLTAYLKFKDKDSLAVSTTFSYRLTGTKGTIYSGNGKTDKAGNALVSVALPGFGAQDNLELLIDASYKRAIVSSGIVVPTPDNYLQVQFYPESGGLIYGIESKIVFRGLNRADRPVDFKGEIITNEGEIVKKIESTYQGIGDFQLIPEVGKSYHLKITKPSGIKKIFELPVPQISGVNVNLGGIKTDTLILNFNQFNKQRQVYKFRALMVGEVSWTTSAEITKHAQIKLALSDFPTGLIEFEALDAAGKLVARRPVFVNENKRLNIEVVQIKQQYVPREKVTLDLRVQDENGNPVKADLSISAVNKNLYNLPDNCDMFTYSIIKSELSGYTSMPQFYLTNNTISKELLDNLVVINEAIKYNTKSNIPARESDTQFGKMNDKYDTIGIFSFTKKDAAFFSRILNNEQKFPGKSYTIQSENDVLKISKTANTMSSDIPEYDLSKSVQDIIFTIKPYQISNGIIVFKSSGPNSINYQQGALIAIDGILKGTNPNVLDNISAADIKSINVSTNPVDIQKYSGFNSMGVIEIFTRSGNSTDKIIMSDQANSDMIKSEVKFQSPDYSNSNIRGKQKEDLRKTIYWNSDIRTDDSGEVSISYFNGDIPSEIEITVEGVSDSGLTGSSRKSYNVK